MSMRNASTVVVAKPPKGPLARPRLRWEYNIKTDLTRVACDETGWIQPARMVGRCKQTLYVQIPKQKHRYLFTALFLFVYNINKIFKN
jgi:hypothetical protein